MAVGKGYRIIDANNGMLSVSAFDAQQIAAKFDFIKTFTPLLPDIKIDKKIRESRSKEGYCSRDLKGKLFSKKHEQREGAKLAIVVSALSKPDVTAFVSAL